MKANFLILIFIGIALLTTTVSAAGSISDFSQDGQSMLPLNNPQHYIYSNVTGLSVHSSNALWTATINSYTNAATNPARVAQFGTYAAKPFNYIEGSSVTMEPVVFDRYSHDSDHTTYPIPLDLGSHIETGSSDLGWIIINRDSNTWYEVQYNHYQVNGTQYDADSRCPIAGHTGAGQDCWEGYWSPSGTLRGDTQYPVGTWQAGCGQAVELDNLTRPHQPTGTSCSASGLAGYLGAITVADIASGSINHAIDAGVANSAPQAIFPASHSSGTTINMPPTGAWFRLKSNFNTTHYRSGSSYVAYSRNATMVLNALKKYGGYNRENIGALYSNQANFISFSTERGVTLSYLDFPGTAVNITNIEWVDTSGMMVNANSYASNYAEEYVAPEDPYAGYVPPSLTGTSPLTIQFTDVSFNTPTSYIWTATDVTGNNTPITFSTSKYPPVKTFTTGNYSIRLFTQNAYGSDTSLANIAFVNVSSPNVLPVSNFTYSPSTITPGVDVQFSDASTNATSWLWKFTAPGGSLPYMSSTSQNLTLSLNTVGTWTVKLTATNAAGSNDMTKYIVVTAVVNTLTPVANFTPLGTWDGSNQIIRIQTGQEISFADTSTGIPTRWEWRIVDGYGGSGHTVLNTSPAFTWTPDENTVLDRLLPISLTVENDNGGSTISRWIYVSEPPVAPIPVIMLQAPRESITYHEGSTTNITMFPGESVFIADASMNSPTASKWDIDAGNGSTYTIYNNYAFNFVYTNPAAGNYSIQLTTSNDAGSAILNAPTIVHVPDYTAPPALKSVSGNPGITTIQWNWTYPDTYPDSWLIGDIHHIEVWKDGALFENVTNNQLNVDYSYGTLWTNLAPTTEYTISTRTVDATGNTNTTWRNASASTSSGTWSWNSSGSWTCPSDVTNISIILVGGGGSGKGGQGSGNLLYSGTGGSAGTVKSVSRYSVTPGQVYTFYIGAGGANSTYGTQSNPGLPSTAFSLTAPGGAGGIAAPPGNGGNGTKGYGAGFFGFNGTGDNNPTVTNGGIMGTGYGAGGGGAGSGRNEVSVGGFGANGSLQITVSGFQSGNIPDFVGSPLTSTTTGILVRFTDMSILSDPNGVTYNWSFGDYTYSDLAGNTQHVYTYYGSYDVSLNITNANGSVVETKYSYITIASNADQGGKINTLYPREVSFTLVDKLGKAIVDLPVTAEMTSSSVENTNWLSEMFGLSADTNINSTILTDTTDDGGQVVFPMIASGRYKLTFIDPDRGINDVKTVHPSLTNYIYVLSTSATAIADASADAINITLSTYPPASTNPPLVYLVANYSDTSLTTTGITFNVKYPTNNTIIYTRTISGNSANVAYAVNNTVGAGYVWEINATTTKFGRQSKGLGITLKGDGTNGMASNLIKVGCTNWKCD